MPIIGQPSIRRSAEPNGHKLAAAIVSLSDAGSWDAAKLEWALESIYFTETPGTCLCGHRPIIEHCLIVNRRNGNETVVGNVCVKRFLGLPSDKLFAGINRIAANPLRSLNAETIEYTRRKSWINDWERDFYLDTMRKRKLSAKQETKRRELNEQILYWMGRGR